MGWAVVLLALAAPAAVLHSASAADATKAAAEAQTSPLQRKSLAQLLSANTDDSPLSAAESLRFAARSHNRMKYFPYSAAGQPAHVAGWSRATAAAQQYGQVASSPVLAGPQPMMVGPHPMSMVGPHPMVGMHPAVGPHGMLMGPPTMASPYGYSTVGGALPQWVGPVFPSAHAYFQPYGANVPAYGGAAMTPYTPAYGAYGSALWSDYRMCSNTGMPPEGTPEFPYPDVDGPKAMRKVRRSLMIGQPVGTFAFRKGVQPNTIEADTVAGQHQGGIALLTTYTFKCIGGAGVGRLESMDGLGTRSTIQEWVASKPTLFRYPLGDQPAVPEGHAAIAAAGHPGFVHGVARGAFSFRQKAGKSVEAKSKSASTAAAPAPAAMPSAAPKSAQTVAAEAGQRMLERSGMVPGLGAPYMPGMVHPYMMHSGLDAFARGQLPGHAVTRDPLTGEDFDITPISAERGARLSHYGPYGVYSPASPLMLNGIHTSYLHPSYSTGFLHPASVFYHPAHWAGFAHPLARTHAMNHWTHPHSHGYYSPQAVAASHALYSGYTGYPGYGYGYGYGFKGTGSTSTAGNATSGNSTTTASTTPTTTTTSTSTTTSSKVAATGTRFAQLRLRHRNEPAKLGGTPVVNPGPNTGGNTGSEAARAAADAALQRSGATAAVNAGAANTMASGAFPMATTATFATHHHMAPPGVFPATAPLAHVPYAGGSAIGFPYDMGMGAAPSPWDPYVNPAMAAGYGHPMHPLHAAHMHAHSRSAHLHAMYGAAGMGMGGMYGPGMGGMYGPGMGMGRGMGMYGVHGHMPLPRSMYGAGMGMGGMYGAGMGMYGMGGMGYGPMYSTAGAVAATHARAAAHAAHRLDLDADAHQIASAEHAHAANVAHVHAGAAANSALTADRAAEAISAADMAGGIMLQTKAAQRSGLRGSSATGLASVNAPAGSTAAAQAAADILTVAKAVHDGTGIPASAAGAARLGRHLRKGSIPSAASSMRFAATGSHAAGGPTGATASGMMHPYLPYSQPGFGNYFPQAALAANMYNPVNPMFAGPRPGMPVYGYAHSAMPFHPVIHPGMAPAYGYGAVPMAAHPFAHAHMMAAQHAVHATHAAMAANRHIAGAHHAAMSANMHHIMAQSHQAHAIAAAHPMAGLHYGPWSHVRAPYIHSWLQLASKSSRSKTTAGASAAAKALATRHAASVALMAGRTAAAVSAATASARAVLASTAATEAAAKSGAKSEAGNKARSTAEAKGKIYGPHAHPYAAVGAAAAHMAYYGPTTAMPAAMYGGPWGTPAVHMPMHHGMASGMPVSMGYMHPMHPAPFYGASGLMPYAHMHPFAHAYSPYQAGQYHPYHHPMYAFGPGTFPGPHQSVLSSLAMGQMYAVCRQVNLPPASPTPDFPFYNRHASEAKYIHEQLLPGLPVGTYAVRMAASGDGVAVDVNVPLDKANPTNMGPTRVAHYKFRCEGNQLVDSTDPARSYYSLESLTDSIPVLQNPVGSIIPETMHIAASGLPVTPAMLEHLRQMGIVNEQVKKANSGQVGSGIVY